MKSGGCEVGDEFIFWVCLLRDERMEVVSLDFIASVRSVLDLLFVGVLVAVCRSLKRSKVTCTIVFSLLVKTFWLRRSDSSFSMARMHVSTSDCVEDCVVRPWDAAAVSIRSFSVIRKARVRREEGDGPSWVYLSNRGLLEGSKLGKDR